MTDPVCVNLREQFGHVYRISFDESYDPHHVPKKSLDPWMMTIPCARGVIIYPHGGTTLAVELDYHPGLALEQAHRLHPGR
jgi:hypothetical protein